MGRRIADSPGRVVRGILPQIEYFRERLHYDPSTGIFTWMKTTGGRRAGTLAGTLHPKGYIYISRVKAHRLAWVMYHGEEAPHEIDHINGDKTDNRIANLRAADRSMNNRNSARRRDNKSGLVGVHYSNYRNIWVTQISRNGRRECLYQGHDFFEACCRRKSAEAGHGYTERHGK